MNESVAYIRSSDCLTSAVLPHLSSLNGLVCSMYINIHMYIHTYIHTYIHMYTLQAASLLIYLETREMCQESSSGICVIDLDSNDLRRTEKVERRPGSWVAAYGAERDFWIHWFIASFVKQERNVPYHDCAAMTAGFICSYDTLWHTTFHSYKAHTCGPFVSSSTW